MKTIKLLIMPHLKTKNIVSQEPVFLFGKNYKPDRSHNQINVKVIGERISLMISIKLCANWK